MTAFSVAHRIVWPFASTQPSGSFAISRHSRPNVVSAFLSFTEFWVAGRDCFSAGSELVMLAETERDGATAEFRASRFSLRTTVAAHVPSWDPGRIEWSGSMADYSCRSGAVVVSVGTRRLAIRHSSSPKRSGGSVPLPIASKS